MNSYKSVIVALLYGGLLAGCSSTVTLVPELVAEPLQIEYENEVRVLRLEQLINSPELTTEQRARLLYDRATVYERLGLKSMARFDYDYAIKLKPDFAAAYSAIGVHLTLAGQYDRAYEAFDSANDLDPNYQFAYLSRGIALYYGNRPHLGFKDMETYLSFDPNDPYRVIWHYIVQMQNDSESAPQSLRHNALNLSNDHWGKNIVALYLGEMSEKEFLATLNEPNLTQSQKAERQCEAYFYLGKKRRFEGDHVAAFQFYKLALATNVYDFIEHKYARLELDIDKAN